MNVQFFPSRQIALYMGKTFLLRTLAVLAALVLVLQTLDLLGESGKILAVPGNGDAQLWEYVSLRIPQLVARFLPFAVLLGTLITLVSMNQSSEIISMKAAGISAHQIIAPLVLASLVVAAFAFVFQERIVTRATARLNDWQAVDYGKVPAGSGTATNVWVREGDDLIYARSVEGQGNATRLTGVAIYVRSQGTLESIVTAASGRPDAGGWRLNDVETFNVERGQTMRAPTMQLGSQIEPERFTLAAVRGDEQDFVTLKRLIGELQAGGRNTTSLEAELWHKLSGPLSAILMPLLAAVAAFGLARSGQLFVRAVAGMALGFAYFVADNFALAMGNFGAYPPFLAAWAPFFLFLLIGETVLLRTEE
nr:LPS export ABC transporter permease LptG [Allosphingosinicella indica]